MGKDKRRYVRPGQVASHYLQARDNHIRENQRQLEALGLHHLPSHQTVSGHMMTEADRTRDDEDDYIPSGQDEEYEEAPQMSLRRSSRRNQPLSTPLELGHHRTPLPDEAVGSTSQGPEDIQAAVGPTASGDGSTVSTRTRGAARGLQPGDAVRPWVLIFDDFHAPVGPHATSFAGEAGCRIRQDLTDLTSERWRKLPASQKAPIVQGLSTKFDITGTSKTIDEVIDAKCSTSFRQLKYKLHKGWKGLVEEHGVVHVRANPPASCPPDIWEGLIDHVWTTEKFKKKSRTNFANRSHLTTNHACGSKSLPARAYETMQKNGGQLGSFHIFYKDTRFNVKNGKWATPICESLYNQMRKDEEDQAQMQASQPDTAPAPLTPEEMSVKYLRRRSGVVKGIGMRPSSSMRTTATSHRPTPTEEMARLHLEIQMERQQRTQIEQQMEEQQRQLEEQKLQMNQLMVFMQGMGYQNGPPPPPPDDGSAGCGLVAS